MKYICIYQYQEDNLTYIEEAIIEEKGMCIERRRDEQGGIQYKLKGKGTPGQSVRFTLLKCGTLQICLEPLIQE